MHLMFLFGGFDLNLLFLLLFLLPLLLLILQSFSSRSPSFQHCTSPTVPLLLGLNLDLPTDANELLLKGSDDGIGFVGW